MKSALLACLFASSASAQPQSPAGLSPVEPKPHSDGVIVAQVSDAQGRPLSAALLVLSGTLVVLSGNTAGTASQQISRRAASDASGRARFTDLPNGTYWAEARMAGCLLAPTSANNTQLEGDKAQGQLQLTLLRRPVLTGRVIDERGTPLLNARVQAFRPMGTQGEQYLDSVSGASTDDRGIYRISVNDPGRYWLMASHMEDSFPRGSAPRSTGVVFYPNSPDLLSAQPAELSFDQPETTLDITLPPAARTEVAAGILSGPEGRPCTRCRFSLQRVEGPFSYELSGGETGRDAGFDTRGVPPGQYRIYVEEEGSNQGWWAIEEASLVEFRATELTIQTQPPVAVSGRVTLEDPPGAALEEARERTDAVVVELSQVGSQFFAMRDSAGRAELSLQQSEFTLGMVPPERLRLKVSVQFSDGYLAAIVRQGRDLPSPVLDFSQPGPWTNLEVRVRFDMAVPQFRIAANTMATVEASEYRLLLAPHPEENLYGRHTRGNCVPDGSCYVPPLPPGRYWVIVFRAKNQIGHDLWDPEVRNKLAPWGREITLVPGENPRIDLTLAPDKAFAAIDQ